MPRALQKIPRALKRNASTRIKYDRAGYIFITILKYRKWNL